MGNLLAVMNDEKQIKINGQDIVIKPEYLVSYNNGENRLTSTYLYQIPEDEIYVLQIHKTLSTEDEFQLLTKDMAKLRHEKYHPMKVSELN